MNVPRLECANLNVLPNDIGLSKLRFGFLVVVLLLGTASSYFSSFIALARRGSFSSFVYRTNTFFLLFPLLLFCEAADILLVNITNGTAAIICDCEQCVQVHSPPHCSHTAHVYLFLIFIMHNYGKNKIADIKCAN